MRKQKQVSLQIQLFAGQNPTPSVPTNMNGKLVPLLVKLLRAAAVRQARQHQAQGDRYE
jgi:hypothetical protein